MKGKTSLLKISGEHPEDIGFDERNARNKKIALTQKIMKEACHKRRQERKHIELDEE